AGHRGEFVGHAEVFYCMDAERYPDVLHHQVHYVQRASIEGVQVGVGLWNFPRGWEQGDARDIQGLGVLPIVAPVYADARCTTSLGLTNCSTARDYDVEAVVTLALTVDDTVVDRAELTIPPHGTWLEPITTAFPDAEARLRASGGRALVVIRPENVRTLAAQF